jgi:hypothetical protein
MLISSFPFTFTSLDKLLHSPVLIGLLHLDGQGLLFFQFNSVPALNSVVGLALQPNQGLGYCVNIFISGAGFYILEYPVLAEGLSGGTGSGVHHQYQVAG